MADREKIIKGLECIISSGNAGMKDDRANCIYPGGGDCVAPALRDALALLKAQEPVSPVKVNRYMSTDENGDWFSPETYDCGNCGTELHDKASYCHVCGRAVKRNECKKDN